ncbi:MAG: hypothetical protein HRU80_08230 [Ignavibacteriales bacterium]|nr:MAG: hypothetical protein HRU80_08230 [Ignavibacteriales bacterium]
MKMKIKYYLLSSVIILIIVLNFMYYRVSTTGNILYMMDGFSLTVGTCNGLGIDGMYIKDYAIFGFSPSIIFILVTTIFLQNTKVEHEKNKSMFERIRVSSILEISLTILVLTILCSPHFVRINYFENPYFFIVIGVFFGFVMINIFKIKEFFLGDCNQIKELGFMCFLIGCSLAIETSNYFDFYHNEGTNIHRDLNGAVIVPYNLLFHINLPGYYLWRGLLYYNIIALVLRIIMLKKSKKIKK